LLAAVAEEAVRRGARRLWLITSNDNLDALRFYQRRGIVAEAIVRVASGDALCRALLPRGLRWTRVSRGRWNLLSLTLFMVVVGGGAGRRVRAQRRLSL
jgi:Acetyltransferase (GNAT) family